MTVRGGTLRNPATAAKPASPTRIKGMSLVDTAATSLRGLANNKLRSGLTALGIIIGVTAVVSLMAIGRGAQEAITSRIRSLGTNLLFVSPGSSTTQGIGGGLGSAATLTLEDAYALYDAENAPAVSLVAPESTTAGQISALGVNTRTRVSGVTAEYEIVRNAPVQLGAFITPDDVSGRTQVVVLGSRVAETLFGTPEDSLGQTVRINQRPFTVVGVLQSKGGTGLGNLDDQAMVPITTLQDRLVVQRTTSGAKTIQMINVQAINESAMSDAQLQITDILRDRHRIADTDDFVVTNQQDAIATITEATNVFVVFLGAIAGISLLVGGIGIMNIMLVSVTERTREIGIRKAVGARRRDIMLQFLGEAGLLSLVGGLIGVAGGWAIAKAIGGMNLGNQTITTVVTGDVVAMALVVAVAVGLASGLYPAMRASRLHPIEALRYE